MQTRTRRIILLPLLIMTGCWSGCASPIDSPREPFMIAQTEATAAVVPERGRKAFNILDGWNWPDTLRATAQVRAARAALASGRLGLYSAAHFRLADGTCRDCPTPPAALWHFRDEVIAVPRQGIPVIGSGENSGGQSSLHPPAVWIGAPEVIDRARVGADGLTVSASGEALPLALPPENPLDRADVDASTARFFSRRAVRLRGSSLTEDGGKVFVARTIWPLDSRIEKAAVPVEPLSSNELLSTLIDAQVVGTASAFPARLLFDSLQESSSSWDGKAVFALVLSGAQGDDDGASAGHLAVATGFFGPRGEWSDWLVENFYPHQASSVKGITSASVPIDNYLLDLNSGQLFFRPAYMLIAVLRRPDAAHEIHNALHRTMLDYYCRHIEFDTAARNSTAMSVDPIRELGWRIPTAGPTSRVVGLLGAPLAAVVQLSFSAGADFYNTMTVETTRLLPRVAFEVIGHDLLYLVQARHREGELTRFEQMLVDDVEAVLFIRLPQIPTQRRYGTYPVRSLLQYGARALSAPSEYESAPEGEEMTLPEELKRSCELRREAAEH